MDSVGFTCGFVFVFVFVSFFFSCAQPSRRSLTRHTRFLSIYPLPDPLGLGSSPEQLAWNVEAELIHARLAMMGVAGCLYASFAHSAGAPVAEWYEAGKVYMDAHPEVSFGALVWTTVALSGFVEFKRLGDIRNRGSQNDGVVKILGGDEFKGVEPSYPGGPLFDPMGLSRGSPEKYQEYKTKEIKNGRLAMVAFVGFAAQYAATGAGPLANLAAHLADPAHANFGTSFCRFELYVTLLLVARCSLPRSLALCSLSLPRSLALCSFHLPAHNGVSVPFITN
jgi:light-harvesting complex I chlorophyll a/b binding protein 5